MANLTVTAGSVLKGSGATEVFGTAGETITAGMPLYMVSATNKLMKADASTAAKAAAVGVSLCGAADGQPIAYLRVGNLNPGATVTVGKIYTLSDTAGAIAEEGDNGTGDFVTVLGVGTTTSNIVLDIQTSGIAKP